MKRFFAILGKLFLLMAVVFLGRDALFFLEFETYQPMSVSKFYQLLVEGEVTPKFTTGYEFIDIIIRQPAYIVFGAIGLLLYVLTKKTDKF